MDPIPQVLAVAREKRRLKTAAKVYKTAPRKSGKSRLFEKTMKLSIEALRLAAKPETPEDERAWAERLARLLHQAICDPLDPPD